MSYPPGVREILDELRTGAELSLGDRLIGLYLRGSLVLGDFDQETSDVDFVAVTRDPVSKEELRTLAEMHRQIATAGLRYSHHLEGAYIDQNAVRTFAAQQRRHPEILAGKDLRWANLRENWVLERWTVRERGVALVGPPARSLIDPIAVEDLRSAARSEILRRVEDWASEDARPPRWLHARFMQAFETETICRALYTVRFGELCSKPAAVHWAREALPEPWPEVVARYQFVRADPTDDAAGIEPVKAFARWAATNGTGWTTQS